MTKVVYFELGAMGCRRFSLDERVHPISRFVSSFGCFFAKRFGLFWEQCIRLRDDFWRFSFFLATLLLRVGPCASSPPSCCMVSFVESYAARHCRGLAASGLWSPSHLPSGPSVGAGATRTRCFVCPRARLQTWQLGACNVK